MRLIKFDRVEGEAARFVTPLIGPVFNGLQRTVAEASRASGAEARSFRLTGICEAGKMS